MFAFRILDRQRESTNGSTRSATRQRPSGSALLSYLLFESVYCQELMALGRADAQARLPELQSFLAGG